MPSRRRAGDWALRAGPVILALAPVMAGGLAYAGDAPAGRQKAAGLCVNCHGELGLSTLPDAPNLAGQPEIYTVNQLRAFRSGKRASEIMSVIAKPLTNREIDDLAAWYGSVSIDAKAPAR